MKKFLIQITFSFAILSFLTSNAFSKELNLPEKDRFLIINNYEQFFEGNNGKIVIDSFILHNIFPNESSKPIFESVNELSNVVSFNIKSRSEQDNSREAYLTINKNNYQNTFRLVLNRMGVSYIVYDNSILTVDEFYILKK